MCDNRYCYTPRIEIDNATYLKAWGIGFRSKYWRNGENITVSLDPHASVDERRFVMDCANEWSKYCNIRFEYNSDWKGSDIRIGINPNGGSWSYIGTDASFINTSLPTMNLGWLHEDIKSGDKGTVLHEFGHALGLMHEHILLNFDEEKVYKYFEGPPNFWDRAMVKNNIFPDLDMSKLDVQSIDADRDSVMIYPFPAALTKDGKGTSHNSTLSERDKLFINTIYPKQVTYQDATDQFIVKLLSTSKTAPARLTKEQGILIAKEIELNVDDSWHRWRLINEICWKLGIWQK